MAVREVTMYRVVCDGEGCGDSTSEHSDFFAWADPGTPLDQARDADWYIGEFGEFCEECAPRCPCGVPIRDDDDSPDGLCEDCQDDAGVADPLASAREATP